MGLLTRYSYTPTEPPLMKATNEWPPFDGPIEVLPRTRADRHRIYGNPGAVKLSRKWKRANIVSAHIPGVNHFPIHRLVEPYAREAFRRAFIADPNFKINPKPGHRAWGFNYRHMRHDPSRPLSDHASGIAIDIDSINNGGKYFKRGEAPVAWSEEWYKIWPKSLLSEAVVRAFQSVGFAWGADWDEDGDSTDHTYLDLMHMALRDRSKR